MAYLRLAALGGALALAMSAMPAAAQDWEPRKPIDFVIMAGAGGGADQIARFIQSVVEKKDMTNRPLVPNNKGGGSGADRSRPLVRCTGPPSVGRYPRRSESTSRARGLP